MLVLEVLIAASIILGGGALAMRVASRPDPAGRQGPKQPVGNRPARPMGKTGKARQGRGKSGKKSRQRRSLLVTAYNHTGLPPTQARDVPELAAELSGKLTGATGRGAKRAGKAAARPVGKAGKAAGGRATEKAGARWEARRQGEATPPVRWFRRTAAGEAGEQDTGEPNSTGGAGEAGAGSGFVQRPVHRMSGQAAAALRVVKPRDAAGDSPGAHQGDSTPPTQTTRIMQTIRVNQSNQSNGGTAVTTPDTGGAGAGAAPASAAPSDLSAAAKRNSDFTPESSQELLAWMAGEVAGLCAYADALAQAASNAVNAKGLDPQAVAGIHDYANSASEAAKTMAHARRRYLQVYQEVIEAADKGVRMPYNGRFFSQGAA